ncbi:MAG: endonuclease Q family protein [Candidatus Omnitrophota bacterium]|nr:endonuclease Q family protein [Candidatus Omnitrophota bacterium]
MKNRFICDFHIHSKYSRATSKDMDLKNIAKWAKIKGISLMGTGDFTHFLWLQELKSLLKPAAGGLFSYDGTLFVLSSEISCIYSKNGRVRKIHIIILAPDFETVEKINKELGSIGNLVSDGRPILGLDARDLVKIVMDKNPNCFIIPAHIWTPWFSLFGANSGFDTIEDCFEDQLKHIGALETGLSSDPAMNWRWEALDKYCLVSNSDAHSPQKIGREANIFSQKMDYYQLLDAIKNKDKEKFLATIEFFPQEGKYHWDGHRACQVRLAPAETRKNNYLCPKCGKKVTVGVLHRVEELSDRKEGFIPEQKIPFYSLVPLNEIISGAIGKGISSLAVKNEYLKITQSLGGEITVLFDAPEKELIKVTLQRVADGILNAREGRVKIQPGYDGEYGKIKVFNGEDKNAGAGQLELF